MRVLIYAHAFAPSVGGAETLVMMLAQGLAESMGQSEKEKDGQGGSGSVTVMTPTPSDGFEDKSLPFRVVRRPGLRQLVRSIREADIVHLAGPCFVPMLLGLILRKPTVVEHHGFQSICPNGLLLHGPTQMPCPGHFMAHHYYECLRCNSEQGKWYSFKIWLLTFPRRWLSHRVSVNVTITGWLATVLRLPRTTVIYCGIPGKSNGMISPTLRPPLTFAFMGRLVETKGVRVLLQAAHRLKAKGLPFHLKIIGDGPGRLDLEAQADALKLNDCVTFTGYLPEQALELALADVAIIVMPSLAGETFGLVAAENMARGRLIIVSDDGALSDVVGDTGLKFPAGDASALSDCLRHVLERPELASELGMKARKRALQLFQQERMVEEHRRVYEQLLKD